MLVGLFGINISKSESQFLRIEKIIKDFKVSELKLKQLRKIEYNQNFREFNKISQINKQGSDYYFITNNGRWDGFISEDILKSISIKKWDVTYVGEFKKNINDFPSERENTPLWKIIESIEKTSEGNLLIVNSLGIPKGLVDRKKVGLFVLEKLGINISVEFIDKFDSKNKYPLGIQLPKLLEIMKKEGNL